MATRPQNIGIKAVEIYFPSQVISTSILSMSIGTPKAHAYYQCVDQAELEKFDGVSQGKYTIGLGQTKMSFCDDREGMGYMGCQSCLEKRSDSDPLDIYSFALTTVSSLLQKYSIDPKSIGRLEVGTETLLDKSKSVKSVLMQLFQPSGNTGIEGVDTVNACYGGTNAVFNALNWIESSAWDGRDAIVCAGDIALYKKGNARPTGGAGCVAMLIGPDAPLAFEPGKRGTYMQHAYDFYKPDLTSEYPVVDGHFSVKCYTEAVDACYKAYNAREEKLAQQSGASNGTPNGTHAPSEDAATPLDRFNHILFHAPHCKLVSKSYARLLYNDYLENPNDPAFQDVPAEIKGISYEASLVDKTVEKTFMGLTKKRFQARIQPSIQVPTLCGNMYCASIWGSFVSLLAYVGSEGLKGTRVGFFSYGSGLASSFFSLKVTGDVKTMVEKLQLQERLDGRRTVPPESYDEVCRQTAPSLGPGC